MSCVTYFWAGGVFWLLVGLVGFFACVYIGGAGQRLHTLRPFTLPPFYYLPSLHHSDRSSLSAPAPLSLSVVAAKESGKFMDRFKDKVHLHALPLL